MPHAGIRSIGVESFHRQPNWLASPTRTNIDDRLASNRRGLPASVPGRIRVQADYSLLCQPHIGASMPGRPFFLFEQGV
jgi:hypothetical protein